MTILQEVRLNQSSWKIPPVIHAVQNDSGRTLKMIIEDETIPSGSTATLSVHRADDTHYDITGATLNTADNSFTADITQALTCPGETKCQLKVSGIVSTYTFIIDVQHDASGVVSPQEGISLTEAVESAETAQAAAEQAATFAEGGNFTPFYRISSPTPGITPTVIQRNRTFPDSFYVPQEGDLTVTMRGTILKVTKVTSSYVQYREIASILPDKTLTLSDYPADAETVGNYVTFGNNDETIYVGIAVEEE